MTQQIAFLQKLMETPFVGHLATRDEQHQLYRCIWFSAEVLEKPSRLVMHIPKAGLADVERNLLISDYAAAILVTVSYESVQIKGSTSIRLATEHEYSYFEGMLQRLRELQYPEKIFSMQRRPLMAVEIMIEELYNQTPGAGAGERLSFE